MAGSYNSPFMERGSYVEQGWNGNYEDVYNPSRRTVLDNNFLMSGQATNGMPKTQIPFMSPSINNYVADPYPISSNILGGGTTPDHSDFRVQGFMGNSKVPPPKGWMEQFKSPAGIAAGAEAVGALGGLFLGMKNSRLAKDQFNFQKDAFMKQFNMQVEDRERSRARGKAAATGRSQY